MKTNNISFKQLKTFLKEDASNTDIQSYISKYEKNGIVDLNPIQYNKTFVREILNNSDKFPDLTFMLPKNCRELFLRKTVVVHSNWDASNVENMRGLFDSAAIKNGDLLSSWDVSNVKDMSSMFSWSSFNQDISSWDVSNVKDMNHMFAYTEFNQDISSWDVSNVENMRGMFSVTEFNQDISSWDVSNVKAMAYMFFDSPFNQDISSWDVSTVKDMNHMFAYTEFNQDISSWDVSNVEDMSVMFAHSNFNQDISNWDVNSITSSYYAKSMFSDSAFSFKDKIKHWPFVDEMFYFYSELDDSEMDDFEL